MSAAIVDCGRARWKVGIWEGNPDGPSPVRSEYETFEVSGDAFDRALHEVAHWIEARSAASIRVVGGAAMRSDDRLVAQVRSTLGVSPEVLSPIREAELFASAVRGVHGGAGTVVCDVGGGSVQLADVGLAWALSLPRGTYAVEEAFGVAAGSDAATCWSAALRLAAEFGRQLPQLSATQLVVGSNQMESFSNAAWRYTTSDPRPVGFALEDLARMLEVVARVAPAQHEEVFPSNPEFMFGARQALCVMVAVSAVLGSPVVIPTDLSVSHGLALELLGG
ncbi:MAG: hypothetical protein HYX34_08760 [Actinobacteria bacterium]|nr:hypothetical protein [Actinomycetota bacterium]